MAPLGPQRSTAYNGPQTPYLDLMELFHDREGHEGRARKDKGGKRDEGSFRPVHHQFLDHAVEDARLITGLRAELFSLSVIATRLPNILYEQVASPTLMADLLISAFLILQPYLPGGANGHAHVILDTLGPLNHHSERQIDQCGHFCMAGEW